MLNLQFRHIIHAAMDCHLIIEGHLLCYKWKALSDLIMDTWMRFIPLRQKNSSLKVVYMISVKNNKTFLFHIWTADLRCFSFRRLFNLYSSQENQLQILLFFSDTLHRRHAFPLIHTWSSKTTPSSLTGVAESNTNTCVLYTHTLLGGRSHK